MDDKDLKECVIRLETKMEFMADKVNNIHSILKLGEKKYASKWVEGVMKGAIGTILTGVLLALLGLIFIPKGVTVAYYIIEKLA